MRENDINFQPDELGGELGKAFAPPLRPAIFDRDGASFNPAEFAQSLHKSSGPLALRRRRSRAQEPDGRQLPCLLCPRRERPRSNRASNHFDEIAPFHSITSSAAGVVVAAMSVTCRRTRSDANAVNRSYWPSAQRYSIATL